MKGNPVLYKSLVIGVIVLFVGVGVQPAVAIIEQEQSVNDDCDICPSISKIINVKDEENINKLSVEINEFIEVYDEIIPNKYRLDTPMCYLLFIILGINAFFDYLTISIKRIFDYLPFHVLFFLYIPIFYYMQNNFNKRGYNIYVKGWELDCYWAVFPPKPIDRI